MGVYFLGAREKEREKDRERAVLGVDEWLDLMSSLWFYVAKCEYIPLPIGVHAPVDCCLVYNATF